MNGTPGEPGIGPAGAEREERLARLQAEAERTGRVSGRGVTVRGGPIPGPPSSGASSRVGATPGYYGQPVVKPPVWTWEVPLYFFVGGTAGMAAVIAAAAWFLRGEARLAVVGLWIAALGAGASALLLVSDLGRPARFLHMLRVFKRRSPMSVGAWTLSAFGGFSTAALVLASIQRSVVAGGGGSRPLSVLVAVSLLGAAFTGAVVGTYTGVLIGATAIPAWFTHRVLLPIHFGAAGLGSAAALLWILGFERPALLAIALATSGAECLVGLAVELGRHGPADRSLREGLSGGLLRVGGLLAGPAAFVLWLLGVPVVAPCVFLTGILLSRFGWVHAGRASARDAEATFAAQRSAPHG